MDNFASEFGFTNDQLHAVAAKGFDLVEAGDLDGAATIFHGLVALSPTSGRFHAALGSVLQVQGQLSDAEASYNVALALDGDAVLARVNRGELRCMRADPGGIEDLKVAASSPSPVQARAQALLRRYAR